MKGNTLGNTSKKIGQHMGNTSVVGFISNNDWQGLDIPIFLNNKVVIVFPKEYLSIIIQELDSMKCKLGKEFVVIKDVVK